MVEPERPQMTIWRRVACWISKATRSQARPRPCTHTRTQRYVKLGPDYSCSCSCSGLWLVRMWTCLRAPIQAAPTVVGTSKGGSQLFGWGYVQLRWHAVNMEWTNDVTLQLISVKSVWFCGTAAISFTNLWIKKMTRGRKFLKNWASVWQWKRKWTVYWQRTWRCVRKQRPIQNQEQKRMNLIRLFGLPTNLSFSSMTDIIRERQ